MNANGNFDKGDGGSLIEVRILELFLKTRIEAMIEAMTLHTVIWYVTEVRMRL